MQHNKYYDEFNATSIHIIIKTFALKLFAFIGGIRNAGEKKVSSYKILPLDLL